MQYSTWFVATCRVWATTTGKQAHTHLFYVSALSPTAIVTTTSLAARRQDIASSSSSLCCGLLSYRMLARVTPTSLLCVRLLVGNTLHAHAAQRIYLQNAVCTRRTTRYSPEVFAGCCVHVTNGRALNGVISGHFSHYAVAAHAAAAAAGAQAFYVILIESNE